MKAKQKLYSTLPSITEVDSYLKEQGLPSGKAVRKVVTNALQPLRMQIQQRLDSATEEDEGAGFFQNKAQVLEHVATLVTTHGDEHSRQVINATGVVIHTNLGRSPLSGEMLKHIFPQLRSYSTVEYDLIEGKRGKRGKQVQALLQTISGAEDALVVNNNAAAVFLALTGLASGKEVIVSRGELVEIGGSFRVPDIMRAAGVKLVEVGTTNRTRLSDYDDAITEETVALMKVHPSNYVMRGFVEDVPIAQLVSLAKEKGLLSLHDLGSGSFYRFQNPALRHIRTIQEEVATGVDLMTFSGDKLLGSVQAGIVVGAEALIQKLLKHPLFRALRLDKVTLSLLEASLYAYLDMETLPQKIPTIGFLEQSQEAIEAKAQKVFKGLSVPSNSKWECELKPTTSLAGGGALPELVLESYAIVFTHKEKTPQDIQTWLRKQSVPIIARVQEEIVWLDFRAVFEEDYPLITETLQKMLMS